MLVFLTADAGIRRRRGWQVQWTEFDLPDAGIVLRVRMAKSERGASHHAESHLVADDILTCGSSRKACARYSRGVWASVHAFPLRGALPTKGKQLIAVAGLCTDMPIEAAYIVARDVPPCVFDQPQDGVSDYRGGTYREPSGIEGSQARTCPSAPRWSQDDAAIGARHIGAVPPRSDGSRAAASAIESGRHLGARPLSACVSPARGARTHRSGGLRHD